MILGNFMHTLFQFTAPLLKKVRQWTAVLLVATFVVLQNAIALPAIAESSDAAEQYIAADGTDLTAVVSCIPSELSDGDLGRAIAESGQDYLERVFQTKDNYDDYTIGQLEEEFQTCLQQKGITPVAQQ
jgi:hypothetical protein